MATKAQKTDNKEGKKHLLRQAPEKQISSSTPYPLSRQVSTPTHLGDPSIQTQPLSNPYFQIAQRQALAAQIGMIGGNRYLQGRMAQQQPAVKRIISGSNGVLQRHCGDWKRHQRAKEIPANCHEFVLREKGATAIEIAKFRADSETTGEGASLQAIWYGQNIIRGAAQPVDQESVKNLPLGTVLLVGAQQRPMHSMIIVEQRDNETMIRGFNNVGTLGVGPRDADDPELRSLHTVPVELREYLDSYWSIDGQQFGFQAKGPIFAMDSATYEQNIRNTADNLERQSLCCIVQ